MLAYNVAGEQGSCDDGEWFGDLTMKKVMDSHQLSGVAFFMIRCSGDQQLKGRHFEIIRTLSEELVVLLEDQPDKTHWDEIHDPLGDLITPPPPLEGEEENDDEVAEQSQDMETW